jgi:DNA invertase Pin-like site-specific DNA recombinase
MSRYRIPMSHSATCICTRCHRAGARPGARRSVLAAFPQDAATQLLRLREQGATYRELAAATGLALGTVHRIIRGGVLVDPATQDVLAELER